MRNINIAKLSRVLHITYSLLQLLFLVHLKTPYILSMLVPHKAYLCLLMCLHCACTVQVSWRTHLVHTLYCTVHVRTRMLLVVYRTEGSTRQFSSGRQINSI